MTEQREGNIMTDSTSREAIKERNKLGYAVAKFVGAVDALLARADECEFDDGLAEVAPSDYWAAVRSAGDEMTFRAEEFEAEYERMKAAQSSHAEEKAALVRALETIAKYPATRAEELSAEAMRKIAQRALLPTAQEGERG